MANPHGDDMQRVVKKEGVLGKEREYMNDIGKKMGWGER